MFGIIDASGIAPHLQCLVAQVRLCVAAASMASAAFCLQVVLTVQLVAQIKLAPFIDDRLDVVSSVDVVSWMW